MFQSFHQYSLPSVTGIILKMTSSEAGCGWLFKTNLNLSTKINLLSILPVYMAIKFHISVLLFQKSYMRKEILQNDSCKKNSVKEICS